MAGIVYPWAYDFLQLVRDGLGDYLQDPWNYADMLYIYGSIVNIALQYLYGPDSLICRLLMVIIILLLITKTFFFLRIFPVLTPIVVMLTNVIYDLRIFMYVYMIMLFLFSLTFLVIGLGITHVDSITKRRSEITYENEIEEY